MFISSLAPAAAESSKGVEANVKHDDPALVVAVPSLISLHLASSIIIISLLSFHLDSEVLGLKLVVFFSYSSC